MVGRNGVFYDLDGQEWDATITKIVSNPISLVEAIWSPYKKVIRWIEQQAARWAETSESASTQKLLEVAKPAVAAGKGPQVTSLGPRKIDVGTVAALGVGVGAIGSFLAALIGRFVMLGPWVPVGILGLILAISGPSVFLAYLKIRRRNLGPLLDASGWAVNGWARINVLLGRYLTQVARLPEQASRQLVDPFVQRTWPWWVLGFSIAAIVLAAVVFLVIKYR
jgi:hypothetical protein